MFFTKKKRLMSPYAQGYSAPSTDSFNTDNPYFKISPSSIGIEAYDVDSAEAPSWIQLRIRMTPIPIDGRGPTICYEDTFSRFLSTRLYDDANSYSQYKEIQITYAETGWYRLHETSEKKPILSNHVNHLSLSMPEDEILYTHSFLTQGEGELQFTTKIMEDQQIYADPPGAVNAYPVWAFGGYYLSGCSLTDIQQIYFSITHDHQSTRPYLMSAAYWEQQGVQIPEERYVDGQTVVFMTKGEHPPNLSKAIQQGAITFRVCLGTDERGNAVYHTYCSYDYQQVHGDIVDIHFKEEKE